MHYHRHTHLILVLVAMLLLLAVRPARGQQRFTVIQDTVSVNDLALYNKLSKYYLTDIRKYRDYYFCVLHESSKFEYNAQQTLLAVSVKDGCSKTVGFPEDYDPLCRLNLLIWNNVLYLKCSDYNDNTRNYRFDYDQWQWLPVPPIPDFFYEDENYYVVPRYGNDMLFVEKNTTWYPETKNGWLQMEPVKRPYLNHFGKCRIIRTKDHYLFIHRGKIDSLPVDRPGDPGHTNTLGDVFGEESMFYPTDKWVFEGDPVRRRHCLGCGCSIGNHRYSQTDTVFHNAFYVNGQLFFIVTVSGRTFIAQSENGKLQVVQPLLQDNHKIMDPDLDNRDLNCAPNYCHLRFTANGARDYRTRNSGTIDVEDTTVYIRYFTYHQKDDSLPIAPDNATEPLLAFLLNNLPNIPLSKLDSCERQLSEVGLGRFIPIHNGYYPKDYQNPKEYGNFPYYRILDNGLVCRREYCVHKQDSVVKSAYLEWRRSYYGPHGMDNKDWKEEIKGEYEEASTILTRLTGMNPQQVLQVCRVWTYNGLTIKLYYNGRMVIY